MPNLIGVGAHSHHTRQFKRLEPYLSSQSNVTLKNINLKIRVSNVPTVIKSWLSFEMTTLSQSNRTSTSMALKYKVPHKITNHIVSNGPALGELCGLGKRSVLQGGRVGSCIHAPMPPLHRNHMRCDQYVPAVRP